MSTSSTSEEVKFLHDDKENLAMRNARIPISKRTIVKPGPYVCLIEAATIDFMAEKTSMPVPKIHCAFGRKGTADIVEQRAQSQTVCAAWKNLQDAKQNSIFDC